MLALVVMSMVAAAPDCRRENAVVERQVERVTLTQRDVDAVVKVARVRHAAGHDILPLNMLCPSIDGTARELVRDASVRRLLARSGVPARRWVISALALWRASDALRNGRPVASSHDKQQRALYKANRPAVDEVMRLR